MVATRYPLPTHVATYGNHDDFVRSRIEDAQWIYWEDRVKLVLEGKYHEVKPLHVELSPTYLCNFACPWCSCRAAREDWSEEDVFHHPKASDATVASYERLHRILTHLAASRTGVMWVGGEPTMHPGLYRAVAVASSMGLQQCVFTNGSLLNEGHIKSLLDASLVFIRFSIDTITPSLHRSFHGYAPDRGYFERVTSNLSTSLRLRSEGSQSTLIGVSIVVDNRNYADLDDTLTYIGALSKAIQPGVDYVIVRPAYQFYSSEVELEIGLRDRLAQHLKPGSRLADVLANANVKLVAPKASFADPAQRAEALHGKCLACGWFSEITPKGDMLLCSDRYGNPDYIIGNVANDSMESIWTSRRRSGVLDFTEKNSCMAQHCPKNGRGLHLNLAFAEIESLRKQGRLQEVVDWITALKGVIPPPTHPFFL